MANLDELRKQLVGANAVIRECKRTGIPTETQQKAANELTKQIMELEGAQKRMGALLTAIDDLKKPDPESDQPPSRATPVSSLMAAVGRLSK